MTDKHRTSKSSEDLRFSVLCNFVDQISLYASAQGISSEELAHRLKITEQSLEEQLFDDPQPPSFDFLLKCAFALELKLTIVTYPQENNSQGTVHFSVLQECWNKAGKPRTAFDLEEKIDKVPMPEKPKVRYIKEGSDKETEK